MGIKIQLLNNASSAMYPKTVTEQVYVTSDASDPANFCILDTSNLVPDSNLATSVCRLENGVVPAKNLPAYVDDIQELYAMQATAPTATDLRAGIDCYYNTSTKLIYTATDTSTWSTSGYSPDKHHIYSYHSKDGTINKSYRWDGSAMVEVMDMVISVTSVGDPGVDTAIPTEKAVRTAINAVSAKIPTVPITTLTGSNGVGIVSNGTTRVVSGINATTAANGVVTTVSTMPGSSVADQNKVPTIGLAYTASSALASSITTASSALDSKITAVSGKIPVVPVTSIIGGNGVSTSNDGTTWYVDGVGADGIYGHVGVVYTDTVLGTSANEETSGVPTLGLLWNVSSSLKEEIAAVSGKVHVTDVLAGSWVSVTETNGSHTVAVSGTDTVRESGSATSDVIPTELAVRNAIESTHSRITGVDGIYTTIAGGTSGVCIGGLFASVGASSGYESARCKGMVETYDNFTSLGSTITEFNVYQVPTLKFMSALSSKVDTISSSVPEVPISGVTGSLPIYITNATTKTPCINVSSATSAKSGVVTLATTVRAIASATHTVVPTEAAVATVSSALDSKITAVSGKIPAVPVTSIVGTAPVTATYDSTNKKYTIGCNSATSAASGAVLIATSVRAVGTAVHTDVPTEAAVAAVSSALNSSANNAMTTAQAGSTTAVNGSNLASGIDSHLSAAGVFYTVIS